MAIHPPSDLVLDVARAADPATARAAAERLKALSLQRTVQVGATEFPGAATSALDATATNGSETTAFRTEKKPDAYTKFEAFVLQTFIQSMFSGEKDEDVFGKGTSGQYWKSMLAGAIADNMAKAGGIGIAKTLRAEDSEKKVAAATSGAAAAAADTVKDTGGLQDGSLPPQASPMVLPGNHPETS